jgi:hypothetical protein
LWLPRRRLLLLLIKFIIHRLSSFTNRRCVIRVLPDVFSFVEVVLYVAATVHCVVLMLFRPLLLYALIVLLLLMLFIVCCCGLISCLLSILLAALVLSCRVIGAGTFDLIIC